MPRPTDQILTVQQMRAAEESLIAGGVSVDELMQRAGRGAAEWVWRLAAKRPVTVLCGPGNNGGDGYVIAEAVRIRGGTVKVIAAHEPRTAASRNARALYRGEIVDASDGEVLVDCLYGSGLTRPVNADDANLLARLAASHRQGVAIDLPSGVDSDSGAVLNERLPHYDLTLALGAWKWAHWLMPPSAVMGVQRLVEIGIEHGASAAVGLHRPKLGAPAADSHKYRRGLLAVIAGQMRGATTLSASAALRGGAGYVKIFGTGPFASDLVGDQRPLATALSEARIAAVLIGPGLGRDTESSERLACVLRTGFPLVLDADALTLLAPDMLAERAAPLILTPHEGELAKLTEAFGGPGTASKVERTLHLAQTANAIVVTKGPDTVIAAPDGRVVCARAASSWLSTAGTGDVLAGTIASRLATGVDPFEAACQGVWLHGEAARLLGPAFTASELAEAIADAYAAAL